ncbi:MAG TPA: PaaI family thioesterase [Roseiarcus sp.]|nr:PaaI family thioesterase [Roseiarcus sp.]
MSEPDPTEMTAAARDVLDRQGFMRHVGARVDHAAAGKTTLSVDRRDALLQQNGFFHGGVVAFLIDNATGAAAGSLLRGARQTCLTAEYKINFVSPAKGERLSCTAVVVKPGRRLTVVEAKVHVHSDGQAKLVAVALATLANVDLAELGG